MDKLIYSHMYNSEIMPSSEIPDDAWFVLPMSIKPGLDTRVRDGNETIPLGMYMSRHPEAIAAQLLIGTIEKYHGKMRVIHKMADTSKLKILC
jgi:hypothetical protein